MPRLAALAAGLLLLAVGAFISLGAVLLAPVGMLIASRVQRARGRVLTRSQGWVVGAATVMLALLVAGGLVAAAVPRDAWRRVGEVADSASVAAAKEPPPAWLERIAPGATQQAAQAPPMSPTLERALMVWSIAFAVGLLGATFGTVGWAGGMLVGYGAAGRWPGSSHAASLDADTA